MIKPGKLLVVAQILLGLALPVALGACQSSSSTAPPAQPPPYYGPAPSGQVPYGYPPAQGQPPAQIPAQRPLLAPLVGYAAWQQELRGVMNELVAALAPANQALVRGIPLVFDPTLEVNAFAGCDEQGAPFLAGTAGILEAIDGIAQTRATDELFGTRTYDAYTSAVLPQMARSEKARAALPAGIIPANLGSDPRRWSRAHEIYDEVLAFTFGHELAHHYLGHTGCAKGQGGGSGPDPTKLGRLALNIGFINQFAEGASDAAGAFNALDAGRARRPQYEWSENGGTFLLDFFARLEGASAPGGGLLGTFLSPVLRSHPGSLTRIPLLQAVARSWHTQHPR